MYIYLVLNKEESQYMNRQDKFWKSLWSMKFFRNGRFLFGILNRALATKDNLRRRQINVNAMCVFYADHDKTNSHLFGDCLFATHIWRASDLGISTLNNEHLDFLVWVRNFLQFFWKE